MPRATGHEGQRGPAMRTRPGIGCVDDCSLMPHIEDAHTAGASAKQYVVKMISD